MLEQMGKNIMVLEGTGLSWQDRTLPMRTRTTQITLFDKNKKWRRALPAFNSTAGGSSRKSGLRFFKRNGGPPDHIEVSV